MKSDIGSWNYRIMRNTLMDNDESLSIIECYYADTDGIQPNGYVQLDIGSFGTVDELRQTLHRMINALDKPIVDIDDL